MKNIIKYLGKRFFEILTKISPVLSCKLLYFIRTRQIPNLKKPINFNEKTTYLKLYKYSADPLVIKCADKYGVRQYVEEKGYKNILNELYGVYDNFDEVDFDKLPNNFALKCTHGCAYNIICSDKSRFNIKKARKKVNKWMNEKYGYATTELHYTQIKPKIIIEKYLCDDDNKMPLDYKIYCFNGKAKCILVCSERDTDLKLSYYDLKWNRLNYEKKSWSSREDIFKPKNLDKMIKISEDLAKDFPYVRVDLYNDKGKIIFGELTFTPACSCAPYYNKYGNAELGNMFCSFNHYDIQVLLSIMNENNIDDKLKEMNVKENYVVINQITNKNIKKTNRKDEKNIIISCDDKGLSKSRNLAILNSNCDIGLISDDDMYYVDDYEKIIGDSYKKHPDADIIAFIVEHENKKAEKKTFKEGKLGFIKSLRISSVQITMNINRIKQKNIKFDEDFGSGSNYYMGEENIFLYDCLRKGLKIYYVPKKIGLLREINESNWFKGYNEEFFMIKGAVYYRMSKVLCIPLILQFAIRKRKEYKNDIKIVNAIKFMLDGVNNIKNNERSFYE